MSRFNYNYSLTPKGIFYRVLSVLAALTLLLWLLPYGNGIRYDYSIGKPWYENTIIANEGFPLLKPDSLLKVEKQRVRQNFKPIYAKNESVAAQQLKQLQTDYEKEMNIWLSSPRYYQFVGEMLNEVYSMGIISAEDYEREIKERHNILTISSRNTGEQKNLEQLFTPKKAYEHIIKQGLQRKLSQDTLQKMDLSNYLINNVSYDKQRSKSELEALENGINRYCGTIQSGQEIVHRGQIVDKQTYQVLRSMEAYENKKEETPWESLSQKLGQTLYMLIIITCLFFYFRQFRVNYLSNTRTMMFLIMMLFSFPALTYLTQRIGVEAYIVPYCMLPILLRVFTDSRTAFMMHVGVILLSAVAVKQQFEFIFIELSAGLIAIYSMRHLTNRWELFQSIVYVTLSSLFCWLCLDLINKSFYNTQGIEYMPYILIIANGIILMISYLLLVPFERIFHFTSNVTLVELANTNNKILRRMSEEVPGTFQHSLQVGNLAMEVAQKIGADTQLVRTAAMYHDIGKLGNPIYFTENQNGVNPHDKLSHVESAKKIINHVTYGLELAEQYKLPNILREFITSHHGLGKVRYFLTQHINDHPNDTIDEKPFTYPGPNPRTREQAILMMADAVEATSRSLKQYTEENISELVDRIINQQIQEGFFNNCPISFQEITTAKQVFKEKLKIIYHTRITYPELNKEAQEKQTTQVGSSQDKP